MASNPRGRDLSDKPVQPNLFQQFKQFFRPDQPSMEKFQRASASFSTQLAEKKEKLKEKQDQIQRISKVRKDLLSKRKTLAACGPVTTGAAVVALALIPFTGGLTAVVAGVLSASHVALGAVSRAKVRQVSRTIDETALTHIETVETLLKEFLELIKPMTQILKEIQKLSGELEMHEIRAGAERSLTAVENLQETLQGTPLLRVDAPYQSAFLSLDTFIVCSAEQSEKVLRKFSQMEEKLKKLA